MRKAQKIRRRLGGSPTLGDPFPDKPKGMHWNTYRRLLREIEEAECGSISEALERFKR